MAADYYLIEGINPEPWEAPQFSRGKGRTPAVYKSEGLRAYQEAIAEEFSRQYPNVTPAETPCSVTFGFWRELGHYKVGDGRASRRHIADATNLQKATEDALQGILFSNDHLVHHIESFIVSQEPTTTPAVLIVFRPYVPTSAPLADARAAMTADRPLDLTAHLHPDTDVPF